MSRHFDIIVVGGGHAGVEAAWAAASLGASVALVTMQREAIGRMSCNPAIGGLGKGQMVREIDALGGLMGLATDAAGIQFRMLNRSKGPAVWAPRAQADRDGYPRAVQELLGRARNIEIVEGAVEELSIVDCRLSIDDGSPDGHAEPLTRRDGVAVLAKRGSLREQRRVKGEASPGRGGSVEPEILRCAQNDGRRRVRGVTLADRRRLSADAVILTTGTFLRGLMHCGEAKTEGGRVGEASAVGVSASLLSLGFELGRLKTGTPPRIHRDTIDYSVCDVQPGDDPPVPFSLMTDAITQRQMNCWVTWTNAAVHEHIRANLHRAPMYSGQIQSTGPRYCPSIEDKVVRFADKPQHQVFLEPEGYDNERVYCNGISTSLPKDVQDAIVREIPGLEQARILQYGYAVEYDFVPTHQTKRSLETKLVQGLFLAGQINGTSGYEEAAGQGLMAGINAVRSLRGQEPFVLARDEAYIGVMIDDLITRPPAEPYRMFTSRAEYRLRLRSDNADQRLTPLGRELGTVDDTRWARFQARRAAVVAIHSLARKCNIKGTPLPIWMRRPEADPDTLAAALLRAEADGGAASTSEARHSERSEESPGHADPVDREMLRCAQHDGLGTFGGQGVGAAAIGQPTGSQPFARADLEQVLIEAKYGGYVQRQDKQIERFRRLEEMVIPSNVDFKAMQGLRNEAREKLIRIAPSTLGQAARIAGVNPADITVLWIYLTGRRPLARRPSDGTVAADRESAVPHEAA